MDKWFKVDLGDAMLASKALVDIEVQLTSIYEAENKPQKMLAVYRHESQGMHCHLIVYLSSTFHRALGLKQGTICDKPPMKDSSVLVGNKDDML